MPFTLESARGIFPNTLVADVVPATIARFNQLNTEDQLALIWFAYLEMGKTITVAATGAASMVFAGPVWVMPARQAPPPVHHCTWGGVPFRQRPGSASVREPGALWPTGQGRTG